MYASIIFAVEPSPRGSGNSILHAQELITLSSGQTEGSVATTNDHPSSSGTAGSSNTGTAAPVHGEITRTSTGDSSPGSSALVRSNGISLFKRYWLFKFQVWKSITNLIMEIEHDFKYLPDPF